MNRSVDDMDIQSSSTSQEANGEDMDMEEQIIQPSQADADAQQTLDFIKGAIEALLFISEKPITVDQISKALETVNNAEIKKALKDLIEEYEEKTSGLTIREIAGGYQIFTNPCYAAYVRNFYKTKHKEKLSNPALECLAIITYKQPVTRADIELIRGVNSDGVVTHLINKELVKVVGRKDVPGKPYLLGTTKRFLEYFGLKSLDQLPKLEEFPLLVKEYENQGATVLTNGESEQEIDQEEFQADLLAEEEEEWKSRGDAPATAEIDTVIGSEGSPASDSQDQVSTDSVSSKMSDS